MDCTRSRRTCRIAAVLVIAAVGEVRADAFVVTRAMQASTIVEIFIDDEQIRVEFEISAPDVAAFANVLPDELYEKVTGDAKSHQERLRTFFESDWVVQGDRQPLSGEVARIVPARRVVRDDVTGEALAVQPADAEVVIRLTLSYELGDLPQTLTIHPPQAANVVAANIGFVCYHDGLPVNDFRYMPGEVTLDLDWVDPWYSRFHNANLRRQFDAPLSAYLYIEPYEVRQEIIVRPKDVQSWFDLGLENDGVIPATQQEELKRRIADFLSERNPVTIDGRRAQGRLDRIHFIHRTLKTTGIIEPAMDLDATSATLGVIFVYPVDELPEHVSMRWELFTPKIQKVPVVASDEAGGLPAEVTPDAPLLEWKNYLTHPTSQKNEWIPPPPTMRQFSVPLFSAFFGGLALGMLVFSARQKAVGRTSSRRFLAVALAAIVVAVVTLPFAKVTWSSPFGGPPLVSERAGKDLLGGLLHNVYRSFDSHDDSLIYDRLAKSISGELLSDVYLETRRSMEVKNQGGLRISVKDVVVTELDLAVEDSAAPSFHCRWRVSGWIGHWGHIHRRENVHEALITIAVRDGTWKITSMEMLDERALDASPASSPGRQGASA